MKKTLSRLGLNGTEISIYLSLLPIGSASSSVLAYKTGILTSTARYACQQMVHKGFLSMKKKGNTLIFAVEPPEKIMYLLEEESRQVERKKDEFSQIVGDLESMMKPETLLPKMRFYEGKEGIIQIYEDMINTGKDIHTWTDISRIYDTIGDYMYSFIEKRVKSDITTFAIMPNTKMARDHEKKAERRKTRYIGSLPIDGEVRIYGDKVAIISFQNEKPIGFVFQNPLIAGMFRIIFENEWKES